jgi:hypothetical protein
VEWTRHPLRCHGAGSGRENTLSSLQLERKEEKKHVGAWGEDAGSIRDECVRTSYVVMRSWAGTKSGGRFAYTEHLARATYGTTPLSLESPLSALDGGKRLPT